MMKTSSPRTFSWISTKISMSAKRRTLALARGMWSASATAWAKGGLLLQATIFKLAGSLAAAPGS